MDDLPRQDCVGCRRIILAEATINTSPSNGDVSNSICNDLMCVRICRLSYYHDYVTTIRYSLVMALLAITIGIRSINCINEINVNVSVEHKSAITDHADRHNCVIDWEGAKKVDKETNRCARWIKEAIWIRKTKQTMNRDEGGYRLSHVLDSLLATPSSEQ